jgi:nucleoside-diphosphate-sugar epimerase
MHSPADILKQIRQEAPPQQAHLSGPTLSRLMDLTAELRAARPDSVGELHRYLSIRQRTIPLPDERVAAEIRGRTVVVTGGSGCLGTVLLEQLTRMAPARALSVAITPPARIVPGVEYVDLDVRQPDALESFFRRHQPDIVFHLAAQRDPGLAERQVAYTISTNVLGTRNVAEAAERAGVRRLIYASTGKALRPYTSNVYASSKRVGEWVMARTAARGRMACSGVRFTHVVDNSIILDRLVRWCRNRDAVRLHSPDTLFYAQSALESAQLMLVALLAPNDGAFRLHMIRDLGWPVSLLDLALGVMYQENTVAPLYVAGYDPGYEETPYPGLYDPMLAGDVSPLINGIEAHQVEESASPAVDAVPVLALEAPQVLEKLHGLEHQGGLSTEATARRMFDEVAWELLAATARATPSTVLDRIVRLTQTHRPTMLEEHLRIDDVFRRFASPVPTPPQVRVPASQHQRLQEAQAA